MDILTPYDPSSDTAENAAYGAMLAMEADDPGELDAPLPDGTTMRPRLLETLRSYQAEREGKGLPVFPVHTARENRRRDDYLRDLYVKPLEETLEPEAAAMIKKRGEFFEDPEQYRTQEVNRAFLSSVFGKPLAGVSYDLAKGLYARQHLDLPAEAGDKEIFAAIRGRYTQEADTAKRFTAFNTAMIDRMMQSAFAGKTTKLVGSLTYDQPTPQGRVRADGQTPVDFRTTRKEQEEFLASVPERLRDDYRGRLRENAREISRMVKKAAPLVEQITGAVERIRSASDPEQALLQDADAIARLLPDNREEREFLLSMVGNSLANLPEDQRGALQRVWAGVKTGTFQEVQALLLAGNTQARQALRAWPGGDPNEFAATSDANTEFLHRRDALINTIRGGGMSLHKATDFFLTSAAINAAPSAWMMPAAMTGGGAAVIMETMAGQSAADMRRKYPGMNEGLMANASAVSGVLQGAIETFSDRFVMGVGMGKMPGLAGLLNKAGVTSGVGRGLAGFGAGMAGTFATEYPEEFAQGGTDLLLSTVAADLSGLKPETDWPGFFGAWGLRAKDEAGKWHWHVGDEQKATLSAILAFGMVAGGGAALNHFKYGAALAQNKTFLRAHGFTEAEVRGITNTTDLEEAGTRIQAAFEEAQKRGRTATPDEQERLAQLRRESIEVLQASNEALAQAGMPRVEKETNAFTDETQYVFIDTAAGTRTGYDTEEEAFGAWGDWRAQQSEDAMDTIREAGHAGFIGHATGEGMANEGTNVEVVNKTATPATEQAAAEAAVKVAENDVRKAYTPAQERQARTAADAAKGKLANIKARIEGTVIKPLTFYMRGILGEKKPRRSGVFKGWGYSSSMPDASRKLLTPSIRVLISSS